MSKLKSKFTCQSCGMIFSKWSGQCTGCNGWNTIIEEISRRDNNSVGYAGTAHTLTKLSEVILEETKRICCGSNELNRVLGGGIILGSAILLGGDPGIGKSTILLQTIAHLSKTLPVLYVTGEESPQQIALRAKRLSLENHELLLLLDTQIENILMHVQNEKPKVLVIDSIQTMQTELIASAPGSVAQVRESAMKLITYAKKNDIALFLIGHVTKDGSLAGPRVLEHMVDTVLYFEGEKDNRYRMLRAIKNRFGAVNELGIFAMTEKGLKEVSHPSAIFLSRSQQSLHGSIITATKEGSRPLLVELQALVDESHLANPRRLTVGLDAQRLSMLLAVLHRQSGISTYNLDIFINVVGGITLTEPATDLPMIFAILSSIKNKTIPWNLLVFGEVGLAGEIRPVPGGQERLKEAHKHGFKTAIIPKGNMSATKDFNLDMIAVDSLKEAIDVFNTFSGTIHRIPLT